MQHSDPLRPRTVRDLFRAMWQAYRGQLAPMLGLSALVVVPLTLLSALYSAQLLAAFKGAGIDLTTITPGAANALTPEQLNTLVAALRRPLLSLAALTLIGGLARSVLVDGLLTYLTSEALFGRKASLSEALANVSSRAATLAAALIVFFGGLLALFVAQAFVVFFLGLGLGALLYLFVAAGSLITPVMILERTGVGVGLARSWRLGRARVWPLLALFVGTTALSLALSILISGLVSVLFPGAAVNSNAAQVALVGLPLVIEVLLTPLLPIGYTLVYYDARVRVESLATAFLATDKPDARPRDVASPTESTPMTRDDVLNLAIITVAAFVLILMYVAVVASVLPAAR